MTPRFYKPRPVPYALQHKVEEAFDRRLGEGVLQPIDRSEWAAALVVVPKAGNTVKLSGDYKVTINPYLDPEGYPMPNPQDLFATLAGGKFYKARPQTGISAAGSEPR